jgi:CubicO group peptidase (beta-lactamase class C family)
MVFADSETSRTAVILAAAYRAPYRQRMSSASPALSVTADPQSLGLDTGRLRRIANVMQRYVDDGRFAGCSAAVGRRGHPAWVHHTGLADKEASRPVADDTVFRIYSMTKPITALAAMMLWEEGAFELTDPIANFIPSFGNARVYVKGTATNHITAPAVEPIRIWHLLTHTSGLTYGFMHTDPVDEMYRQRGHDFGTPPGMNLAAACDDWASLPLLFQPGAEWSYSVGTDVIGRLVEIVSGMPLNEFFAKRIFGPLGMTETGFGCRPDQLDRLAALYVPIGPDKTATRFDLLGKAAATHNPEFLSGGGGLVSTLHDYFQFQQLMLGGGTHNGVRLLAPSTVALMASNHLPGGADLEAAGRPLFSETPFNGVGFGLAMSVTINPTATRNAGSVGDYGWGGAASTWMLIDPAQQVTLTFMVQLLPSSTYQIRSQLKQALYQAIID